MLPTITAIVITHNSARMIYECLSALLEQDYPEDRFEIVVVDNASRDQTRAIIQSEFKSVKLYANSNNIGFGQANNQAMKQSRSELLALINHDAIVDKHWMRHMVDCMLEFPDAGIVGSKIFYSNGFLLQHVGGIIQANALTSHRGHAEFDIGQHDQIQAADYVMGAAVCIRRSVAELIEYFDPRYFMYFEETDFCVMARTAGYQVLYCPQAVAIHYENYSFSNQSTIRYWWCYHSSRLKFASKHYSEGKQRNTFLIAERKWLRHIHGYRRWLLFLCYLKITPQFLPFLSGGSLPNEAI